MRERRGAREGERDAGRRRKGRKAGGERERETGREGDRDRGGGVKKKVAY